jgi:hypothetical protein
MSAPDSHLLQLILSLILVPGSYAVGRVHQWYTHSLRRDVAFREGYDHASHAMFDLAVQQGTAVPATGTPPAAARPRRRATDALTLRGHPLPAVPLAGTGEPPRSAEPPRTRRLPHRMSAHRGRRRRDPSSQ